MASRVSFVLPAKREYVGLVRLAISGLAPALPFDSDTIEDIKLVMSEICTNIIIGKPKDKSAPELEFAIAIGSSDVTIDIGGGEAINDLMSTTVNEWTKPKQSGYGLSIITALMDHVELIPDGSHGSMLRLKRFLP